MGELAGWVGGCWLGGRVEQRCQTEKESGIPVEGVGWLATHCPWCFAVAPGDAGVDEDQVTRYRDVMG